MQLLKKKLLAITGCILVFFCQAQSSKEISRYFKKIESTVSDSDRSVLYYYISSLYEDINVDSALLMGRKAYDIAKATGFSRGMALGLLSQGVVYSCEGNYPTALKFHFDALRISENAGLEGLTGDNYTNIGIAYAEMKDYARALEYYRKALRIAEKYSSDYDKAGLLINIGDLFKGNNNPDSAIFYNLQAKQLADKMHDSLKLSIILLNIGDNLFLKGKNADALCYLYQSLRISESIKNDDGKAYAFASLSQVDHKLGKDLTSIRLSLAGLKIARRLSIAEVIQTCYASLCLDYVRLGDYKKAFLYTKLETAIKDTLTSQQKHNQAISLEQQYEMEKKQHQIDVLNKDMIIRKQEMKEEKAKGYILGFAVLLFSAVIIYLFLANGRNEKVNKILHEQNDIIVLKNNQLEQADTVKNNLLSLKNKLFSLIAHDIRMPLYSLALLFKYIHGQDVSGDEIKAMVPGILIELQRTSGMVENVLHWAKVQMDTGSARPNMVNVSAVARETVQSLQLQANTKQISIHQSIDESIFVFADREICCLVLRNLLSNAVKFVPQHGAIHITAFKDGPFIRVFVKDTGMGISQESIEKITGNYFYTSKGTAGEEGSGLGLMLCRDFLMLSGGEMYIESEVGKGSTFSFSLPIGEEHHTKM